MYICTYLHINGCILVSIGIVVWNIATALNNHTAGTESNKPAITYIPLISIIFSNI